MQATRRDILEYIQRQGQATVKELGKALGLTSTGVRQHLTVLERDGFIQTHEKRGRVGRPALVFTLTEKARALFPKRYDSLAIVLLDEIISTDGSPQVYQMLRRVAGRMADVHRERVEGKGLRDRVETVTAILREQGCLAEWEEHNNEFIVHEYTCPYTAIVNKHHAVCTVDVEFVRQLTGADVRLVRSLLRGEPACSYRIRPMPESQESHSSAEEKAHSLTFA